MYCVKRINDDLFWVGGTDRRLALFENAYPIPRGVSYNAYLLLDEKTVLFDTVDRAITEQFFENIDAAVKGTCLRLRGGEPHGAGPLRHPWGDCAAVSGSTGCVQP